MNPPRKPVPPAVRSQTRGTPHARRVPTAPPVYKPQPAPKVLQAKKADARAKETGVRAPLPAVHAPRIAQRKTTAPPTHAPHATDRLRQTSPARIQTSGACHAAARPATAGAAVQRKAGVAQALKFYPNLHPGAVERIEPASLFRLENFTDQYRLRKSDSHGVYVPNQLYNFVRTAEGATLLHNRYRHPSIAEGRQVLYAGEAFFNNGRLEWWSNGSGHYQPDAEDAAQAALPLDNFYTYQQVIKGEHKRRK